MKIKILLSKKTKIKNVYYFMKELKLICNKKFDKNEIKKLIEWFLINYGTIRTSKLLDKLKILGFNESTKAGISLGIEDLNIPQIKKKLINNTEKIIKSNNKLLTKGKITNLEHTEKIINSWSITNDLLKNEIIKNFRQTNMLNPVYMMIFSGARGNISQIRQLIGMRGLMADPKGEIITLPIKNNLKEGLKVAEYFISCYGARKGLVDTALKTANSGYLTRRLIYVAQNIVVKKADCLTKKGMLVINNKKNKQLYTSSKDKLIGRVLAENIIDKEKKQLIAGKSQDICNFVAKKILELENYVYIRSPLICKLNIGICQLCYGWNLGNGKLVKIGEAVGILAAQSIGEPGTQLTMRTFHTGGVFSGEKSKIIAVPHKGIITYDTKKEGKKIRTKYGEEAFFSLKEKVITIKENKRNISKITLPKCSLIFSPPKKKVFPKQIIAEISKWKQIKTNNKLGKFKEIRNFKTKLSGKIYFNKIMLKRTKKINALETIWIFEGNIKLYRELSDSINRRYFYREIKNKNQRLKLKPREEKKVISINYKLLKKLKNLQKKKNTIVKKITYETSTLKKKDKKLMIIKYKNQKFLRQKSNKIRFKIGEFLQKKQEINSKKITKISGQISILNKNYINVKKSYPYLVSKNAIIKVKNNQLIDKNNTLFLITYKKQKTKDIVQGLPKVEELLEIKKTKDFKTIDKNPQAKLKKFFAYFQKKYENSIANRKSIEKIQKLLVKKIQYVYQSQEVNISDKHIEIIVKQMTSKIIIKEEGDSNLITGEIIDINKVEKINKNLLKKIKYEPIILGITKVSLLNESFISAACFQETTRVLTKAAIKGKIDWLTGLKENIIIGNLIPTGTGFKIF
uniref:RNA polymerase subunit beta' n=1 Tax=Flexiglena variabilis TaxID=2743688 RepID=UPI0023AAD354|nr:RNA polymerase subunit beta' [Flexiglena variabilis]WCH63514.1 RNA polymerase subunit beta' [Flexiglena variabilis]